MSVYRCNDKLSDIPNYTRYVTELIRLVEKYEDYLYCGRFILQSDNRTRLSFYQQPDWHPNRRRSAGQANRGLLAAKQC